MSVKYIEWYRRIVLLWRPHDWTTSQSCKVVHIKINVNLYTPRLKFNNRPHFTAVVLFNNRLNTMREKLRENVVKSIDYLDLVAFFSVIIQGVNKSES